MTFELWITLGFILVLLACSAFLSAAETSTTAASKARLLRLEQFGNRRAGIVNRLRERQDRVIGAILLGNNVVNILASALATSVLIGLFGDDGVVFATLLMTVVIVVFCEVMPKAYAIHRPIRTALAFSKWLRVFVAALVPVTRAIELIVERILRLVGVRFESGINPEQVEEELRGSIDLHAKATPAEGAARLMLHSVLDLGELEVSEVMTHRNDVYALDADLPKAALFEQVLASPYTRIPLWRSTGENVIGILNVKAALKASQAAGGDTPDVAALAGAPWFIPDSTSLLEQLKAFRERREHFAVVVDEYGAYEGIVTLEDIVEEVVGDIFDEHEAPVAGTRRQADGSYIVRGTVAVRDLNREYGWTLPEEDAATIAGLVVREARVIPEAGQVFEFHGFRFEVLRRQRNRITSLRLRPPASPGAQAA